MTAQYRQGDVFIVRVGTKPKPEDLRLLPHTILAEGEVTGHAHRVVGEVALYDVVGEAGAVAHRYLEVLETATVVHEEHGPITLDPGIYEVRVQREWDSSMERKVRD